MDIMVESTHCKATRGKIDQYKINEITSSSPGQLILILYDQAILGCKINDDRKVSKAVAQLIDSLDFSYGDVSTGFFRLYQYIMASVKEKKFDNALPLLTELRQTWAQALHQQMAA